MTLSHMLYLSRTRLDWTEPELEALTAHAQARNARDGLTGLLLYGNGHFLQLLEGRRQPLLLTYDRIARDPRHTELRLLLDGPIVKRTFSHWAMGLLNLNSAGEVDLQRYTRIIEVFPAGAGPLSENTLALTLLKEFRTHMAVPPRSPLPDLS